MEIIGVVKDIKYTSLRDEIPVQMFVPYLASSYVGDMTVYIRTSLDPVSFSPRCEHKVRQLDANLPLYAMRTMDAQIRNSLLHRTADRRACRRSSDSWPRCSLRSDSTA